MSSLLIIGTFTSIFSVLRFIKGTSSNIASIFSNGLANAASDRFDTCHLDIKFSCDQASKLFNACSFWLGLLFFIQIQLSPSIFRSIPLFSHFCFSEISHLFSVWFQFHHCSTQSFIFSFSNNHHKFHIPPKTSQKSGQ